jgi:hypothetical protein
MLGREDPTGDILHLLFARLLRTKVINPVGSRKDKECILALCLPDD